MKSLRVAVYHNLHSGGAKRVTAGHLRDLAQHHEVTLYSLRSADHGFGAASGKASYTVKLYDYTPRPWLRSPFGRLNTVIGVQNIHAMDVLCRSIASDIDRGNHDVVLAHPCHMTNAPTVLKWLKTPSLYYMHELPRRYYEPRIPRPYDPDSMTTGQVGLRQRLNRIDPLIGYNRRNFIALDVAAAKSATRIATNSEHTRNNGQAAYRRDIQVCYLGVDADPFGPGDSGQTGQPRERFVLSVGSLTAPKGFDFVVQAMGTLARDANGQRPMLVIISNFQEQSERDYVTALAQQHDVPLLCLVNVSDAELRDWYARAGCVAYAPVREPFGLVAVEAMAVGTPVVAVAEGGVRETVIDGVTGLVAPREPQAFGRALQSLLDDPAQAQALATRAREHVLAHWTWPQHMQRLETLLAETVETTREIRNKK